MLKNVAGQTLFLYFFNQITGLGKTGDAANLTAYVGGVALADTSATEVSSSNAPGWYSWSLTAAETNANQLMFTGKSTTSDIYSDGTVIQTNDVNVVSWDGEDADTNGGLPRIIVAAYEQADVVTGNPQTTPPYLAGGIVASTTGTTTTLASTAVATADYYLSDLLWIISGTGIGQVRIITGYTAGRVAAHDAWVTNPNSASRFIIVPGKTPTAAQNATATAAALAGTVNARVYAPGTGDSLDLYQGDWYANADGRGITVTKAGSESHWPTTLSTVEVYFTPTARTLERVPAAASVGPISATIVTATGASQSFRFDVTSTQSDSLDATEANGYTFKYVANQSTRPATLRAGAFNVRPDTAA